MSSSGVSLNLAGLAKGQIMVVDIRDTGQPLTDVTAAVNAAAATIAASGNPGAIVIPGVYNFTGTIDLTACTQGVALVSSHRASSISSAGAALRFTGTGNPARAIDARGLSSFVVLGVSLRWTDTAFTGTLLDLEGAGSNSKFIRLAHTLIRGDGAADAAVGIDLNQCYAVDFDHCVLYGSNIVRGRKTAAGADFSNRVKFGPGCYIQGRASAPIRNPGMAWTWDGVTFEPLASGLAGVVTHDAGVRHDGLAFEGCYFGDDSAVTAGAWITSSGPSIEISGGNVLSVQAAGSSLVQVDENGHGPIVIRGNTTHIGTSAYLIDYLATTGHMPCHIEGNGYSNYPAVQVHGTIPGGSVIRTPNAGLTDYADAGTARIHWGDVAGRYIDAWRAIGDTNDRLRLRADGVWLWGDGAGVTDVNLSRTSTGQLAVAGGGLTAPLATKTANYTAVAADDTLVFNSAGAVTLTLPLVSTMSIGKTFKIKNIGAGAVTVQANGGGNIDSATTQTVAQWGTLTVRSTGTLWIIV